MIFLIIGVLYRIDIQLSRNWVSTVAPFVIVYLTNCGKVVYTQFLKTLCRLDRHIILGRIMHDMHMIYCTRTYNMNLEEYIALGRTMWIFRNILHSDVQYNFRYTALGRTVQFLNLYYTRTYSTIFRFILYSDV